MSFDTIKNNYERIAPFQIRRASGLTGLSPGIHVCVETMGGTHGNSVTAWLEMGAPDSPIREQILVDASAPNGV